MPMLWPLVLALGFALMVCGPARDSQPADQPTSPPTDTPSVSDGLSPADAATIAPYPVAAVSAKRAADGLHLTWAGTGADVAGYRVYRCLPTGACALKAEVAPSGDNLGQYEYIADLAQFDADHASFAVTTVSPYGPESPQTIATNSAP